MLQTTGVEDKLQMINKSCISQSKQSLEWVICMTLSSFELEGSGAF